jgi:hypothetical protein
MEHLPKYQDLIFPILRILNDSNGPVSNLNLERSIVRSLEISDSLASKIHTGSRTELQYRLGWARTAAKNKGWIERTGPQTWIITVLGRAQISN